MRRVQQQLRRLVTAAYCPLYLGWPTGARSVTAPPLRQWASRCQGRGRWSQLRWLFLLLLTLTWPCRLLHLIRQTMHTLAPTITVRTGKPRWRQAVEQLWLGLCHALPPESYYTYELYRTERWGWIDAYLHQYETNALLPYLNQDHVHPAIDDKVAFAQLCAQHHLPTPALLGLCAEGICYWQTTIGGESGDDLFIKPRWGARGEGTRRWRRVAATQYQDDTGRLGSWTALVAALAAASRQQPYLVQPCLANHPVLATLSPGALATVRLVTGRTPAGAVEAVAATFKMAWHPRIINTDGLNSPIALPTGELGRAYSYDPICPGYDVHPVTGALITGLRLPDWAATMTLAQRAHHLFPGYVFLGWDIALTPAGPLLLEGNQGWDVVTVQKPQGVPLGQTRFAEICRLWMQALAL